MSTYKAIFGKTIKHLSSDPDNSTYEGQIWYNTTEGKFKTVVATAAWSSATPLINNHGEHIGGSGSGTDGLAFGGEGPSNYDLTEEWNGSGWAAGGAYPFLGESIMGCGDSGPSSIAFGGINNASPGVRQSVSATYDGSSWTATNSLPAAKRAGQGFGTNTAAVAAGGDTAPGSANDTVEEWDGTNWTAVNAMPAGKGNMGGGTGSQTAGLVFGGSRPTPSAPTTTDTYSYDGTNWTTVANMNTGRNQTNGWGGPAGQTASVCAGGSTGSVSSATENWDGTAWSTSPATLASARQGSANGIGTSSSNGIQAGGSTGSYVSTVEEYNFTANTITAAAWASSGSMNTSRFGVTGFGTQTSSIAANGDTFPPTTSRYTAVAEEYNGATWTNITSTGSGTAFATASNLSPGSAGSVYGGEPVSARHEYWDGSSWSEQTDMNAPRYSGAGAGTQTASIMMGGIPGVPANTATEEWNGTSWANQNDAPHGIYSAAASGTQTAAIVFGGNNPVVATTAEYDGTNWTTGGDLLTARAQLGGSGTQTNALAFGGANPPTTGLNATEGYDGTSWSTRPTLGTARRQVGSSGHVSSASLIFGGDSGAKTGATEEFTGETTAINVESVDNS